jgi:hypothetical protein
MKPIFIGGCPRSGTTLLGALLGGHSRIVCVPEMTFKFDLLFGIDWNNGRVTQRQIRSVIQHLGSFRMWGIPAEEPGATNGANWERHRSYAETIEGFVRRYAAAVERREADVWVEHIPSNIRYVNTLLEHFPEAAVVHLVRDGRGVAASLLSVGWGAGTELAAAQYWAEHLAYGFAAERSNPDRVYRLQYEELLQDPHGVLARLCQFAGLAVEEQLGRVTRFPIPRDTLTQHALVARPPDPSRAASWRSALTPRQIETFEHHAGELLDCLGYDLVFGGRATPPSMRERVGIELKGFAWEMRRLGKKTVLEVKHRLALGRPDAF